MLNEYKILYITIFVYLIVIIMGLTIDITDTYATRFKFGSYIRIRGEGLIEKIDKQIKNNLKDINIIDPARGRYPLVSAFEETKGEMNIVRFKKQKDDFFRIMISNKNVLQKIDGDILLIKNQVSQKVDDNPFWVQHACMFRKENSKILQIAMSIDIAFLQVLKSKLIFDQDGSVTHVIKSKEGQEVEKIALKDYLERIKKSNSNEM